MNRSMAILGGTISLLVILSIIYFWTQSTSDPRTPAQASRIDQLDSSPAVPFERGRQAIAEVVGQIPFGSAEPIDPSLVIKNSDVSDAMKSELRKTLTDFLMIYAQNDSQRLVAFMSERGESLSEGAAKAFQAELKSDDENRPSTESDLISAAWNEMELDSKWDGLIQGSSKIVMWHCQSATDFNEKDPYTDDRDTFLNVTNYRHLFDGRYGLADEARAQQEIVVADVQFAIEHKEHTALGRGLYFVRFWWDSKNTQWHPRLFRFVATSGDQSVTAPKLIF